MDIYKQKADGCRVLLSIKKYSKNQPCTKETWMCNRQHCIERSSKLINSKVNVWLIVVCERESKCMVMYG